MYLRDLQFNVSADADWPAGFSPEPLFAVMHTVVEAYLDELPRRAVVLGGAAKVNVQLGPRPAEGIFSDADFGIYPDGVGWIWMSSFDFSALAKADVKGRQLLLLDALHTGLVQLARRTGSNTEAFVNARAAILARPLPLPEIPQEELLRRWGLLPKGKKKRSGGAEPGTSKRKKPRR